MCYAKRTFWISALLATLLNLSASGQTNKLSHHNKALYSCMPCGRDCDKVLSDTPGTCLLCHMPLVKVSSIHFKTISHAEIKNYVAMHPDVVLLDVRTKEEFEGTATPNYPTLKNAINIPVLELESRLSEIGNLKKRKIIVYCSRSHRSAVACYLLTQNGFKNVTNMSGGVSVMTSDELIK